MIVSEEMGYQKLVAIETEMVNSIGIATKILNYMQKVRDNSDPRYARRWPMELLQNTKDCAVEGQRVRIEIVVGDDYLIYRNNSKPFRIKNILSLINQVTSKVGEDEETTGKFGTGFMTTMLLSDRVRVSSVLSDSLEGEELPRKRFSVMIDRSPNTPEGITKKIADALLQLYRVDETDELSEFTSDDFNTEFRYELKNERARKAALTGVEELIKAAKYIFAFSGAFGELRIDVACNGQKRQLCIQNGETERVDDSITRHRISYDGEDASVLVYRRGDITLAVPVGDDKRILPISDTEARLYINYPLIGSESFPFPVILQCVGLEPDDPRSNIALTDNEESEGSVTNRRLILEAVNCYRYFIDALVARGYGGLENFVKTPVYKPYPEHSPEFVQDNIFAALLSIVAGKEIVRCCDGGMHRLREDNLYLPYGESEEIRKRIKDILADCRDVIYPVEPDSWRETLSAYDVSGIRFVTVRDIVELLDFRQITLKDGVEESKWIQKIYDLAQYDEKVMAEIQADRLAIYPTQKKTAGTGHIHLATKETVYRDPGIMECVKDISEELETYAYNPIELRSHLLAKDFVVRESENIRGYYLGNIRTLFEKTIGQAGSNEMEDRQKLERLYGIVRELLDYWDEPEVRAELTECGILQGRDKKAIPEDCVDIFQGTDYEMMMGYLTRYLIWCLKPHASLDNTRQWLAENYPSAEALSFVDHVLSWLDRYGNMRLQGLCIVPNEEGNYCEIGTLFQNRIEDKELYDVAQRHGLSYDATMVHHGIQSVDPGREINDAAVAKALNDYYTNLFELEHKNIDEVSSDIQAIAILLFDWIKNHQQQAEKNMPYLAGKNSFRLLNLKVVGELHEKAKNLEGLAKKLGYDPDSPEEMDELFSKIESFSDAEELYSEKILEAKRKAKRDDQNFSDKEEDSCVYVGDFPETWRDREKEELCRWIGEQGESFARDYYVKTYEEKGFRVIDSTANNTVLRDDRGETVSIRRCDTPTRKQAGYDIVIEPQNGEKQYVEVKSRTVSSTYRDVFKLSPQQFCCSERYGEHYTVFLPLCSFRGEEAVWTVRYVLSHFRRALLDDRVIPGNKDYYYYVNTVPKEPRVDL